MTGQRATVTVDVRLRDVTLLGRLLREAAERGRAQVLATRWVIDSGNPAYAAVRTAAAANARGRAEAYAAGLGMRVGRVLEAASTMPRRRRGRHAAGGGRGAGGGRRARGDGRSQRALRPRD